MKHKVSDDGYLHPPPSSNLLGSYHSPYPEVTGLPLPPPNLDRDIILEEHHRLHKEGLAVPQDAMEDEGDVGRPSSVDLPRRSSVELPRHHSESTIRYTHHEDSLTRQVIDSPGHLGEPVRYSGEPIIQTHYRPLDHPSHKSPAGSYHAPVATSYGQSGHTYCDSLNTFEPTKNYFEPLPNHYGSIIGPYSSLSPYGKSKSQYGAFGNPYEMAKPQSRPNHEGCSPSSLSTDEHMHRLPPPPLVDGRTQSNAVYGHEYHDVKPPVSSHYLGFSKEVLSSNKLPSIDTTRAESFVYSQPIKAEPFYSSYSSKPLYIKQESESPPVLLKDGVQITPHTCISDTKQVSNLVFFRCFFCCLWYLDFFLYVSLSELTPFGLYP